ncbi:MAG: DUF2769 domain-containing protein [Actinobacteria bacterium]|nr:MAG: DUF2769 domain-containing protein [Actinomycetota bacterium]
MKEKEVDFSRDNAMSCMCIACPVEKQSDCAHQKMESMPEKPMQSDLPAPEEVPLVYCSQGMASCGDLDFSQQCICPTCNVWKSYGLAQYKYCKNGPASQMG